MPELPEVENTRRHLKASIEGRTIGQAAVTHHRTARHNASADEIVNRLTKRKILSVGRRGKFLVMPLDYGFTLVAHLGMSGRFGLHKTADGDEIAAHTHFTALLDDGTELRFVDPRTFGYVAVFDQDEIVDSGLGRLGPDAWSSPPSVSELSSRLAGRKASIKVLLLDQRLVAGLGNIYVDESLFLSRIHPGRPGGRLREQDTERLLGAIRVVLEEAIEHGGTTLVDMAYRLPDGNAGDNLGRLNVYGRDQEPCPRCSQPIERTVIRARSTHFCPSCQAT